ncbi:MAG: hypothetical protein ACI35O_11905 [Bacillaceae bacterium]
MKKVLLVCFFMLLYVSGCSNGDNAVTKKDSWSVSPTFSVNEKVAYGKEGVFAITRVNGEDDAPDFPADEGRLYSLYFLDDDENIVGKDVEISAISKEDDTTTVIWEGKIDGKTTGAKLAVGKEGIYKIVVKVNKEEYTNFIVEVKADNF